METTIIGQTSTVQGMKMSGFSGSWDVQGLPVNLSLTVALNSWRKSPSCLCVSDLVTIFSLRIASDCNDVRWRKSKRIFRVPPSHIIAKYVELLLDVSLFQGYMDRRRPHLIWTTSRTRTGIPVLYKAVMCVYGINSLNLYTNSSFLLDSSLFFFKTKI